LQEAVAGGAVGQVFGPEGLERDGALLLVVEAQVDDAHAAQEERAGDFVAARDAGAGGVELHDVLLMIARRRAPGKCKVAFCVHSGVCRPRRSGV
jgi:hypothetical protein